MLCFARDVELRDPRVPLQARAALLLPKWMSARDANGDDAVAMELDPLVLTASSDAIDVNGVARGVFAL